MSAITLVNATEILDAGQKSLSELALDINREFEVAERHVLSAVNGACETGRLLIEAKNQVAHGQWEEWLSTNCTIASRTARAYMRLASKLLALPLEDRQRVADLPVRQALKAIMTDPTPPVRRANPRPTRSEVEHVVSVLRHTTKAINRTAKEFEHHALMPIKAVQVARLRGRLAAAIAELDLIEARAEREAQHG